MNEPHSGPGKSAPGVASLVAREDLQQLRPPAHVRKDLSLHSVLVEITPSLWALCQKALQAEEINLLETPYLGTKLGDWL